MTRFTNPLIRTRFVIFSLARSGSTALTSTLGTHPDASCYGSPFFKKIDNGGMRWTRLFEKSTLEKRHTDPVGYVYNILNYTPGPSTIGFKLWGGPNNGATDAIAALAADTAIKKIILNRENHMACFSSNALVAAKHKDPEAFVDRDNPPRLDFDAEEFKKFTYRRNKRLQYYRDTCKGDLIEIPYADLIATGVPRILDFLGLPRTDLAALTRKRNSSNTLSRFKETEHDKIRSTLDDLGHPEWVSES